MSTIIKPSDTCFLIVEPKKQLCKSLGENLQSDIMQKFNLLDEAADMAGVPRWFATFNRNDNFAGDWLSKPCSKTCNRVFNCDDVIMPWRNVELVQAIKGEGRGRLVICGFWLDTGLEASALEALTAGFDVHLITDLTFAHDKIGEETSFRRLDQMGVVPITLRGLIFELMCWIENREILSNMKQLLESPVFSKNGVP